MKFTAAPLALAPIAALAALLLTPLRGDATPPFDYVLAVTSDYEVSGQVATVDVFPMWTVEANVSPVHSDAEARWHDGLVYIVNRLYGDNIQVLDPAQGFATVRQFSVGPGTNPVDLALVSAEKAYVSRKESAWLLEVDTTTGARTDSIDLSAFADGDGIPEMDGLAIRGGYLFVALQRLDRDYYWNPVPPSYLVIIDTNTNEIVDPDPHVPGVPAITLTGLNPYRTLHLDGDDLYVAESGAWGSLDGGIERVDTGSLTPEGFVTTESQLGGDLYDFTLPIGGRAHAVVASFSGGYEQFCVSFDWSTGAKIADVWRPGGYDVMDIETHPGTAQLFLADRVYTNPGVRVFDANDDSQLTTSPLNVGLPPHDLLVIGDAVTGASGAATASLSLSATPNPARVGGGIEFALSGGAGDGAGRPSPPPGSNLCVYDASGRRVREVRAATEGTFRWDGRDGSGAEVSSGVYFARFSVAGEATAQAKVVLLR